MKKYLWTIFLVFFAFAAQAATDSTLEIKNLGQQWATALASGNPEKIAMLYDPEAFVYATYHTKIATRPELIAYFKKLMKLPDLKVTFNQQNVRVFWGTAINSGLYTFSYKENNKTVNVPARYTFVYILSPAGWVITEHHSSVLPAQ